MTLPGSASPSDSAMFTSRSPARFVLATALLALGLGDLAAIHWVLLPRYVAGAPIPVTFPAKRGAQPPPPLEPAPAVAIAPPHPTSLPTERGEGAEPGEAGERHPPTEVAHTPTAAIAPPHPTSLPAERGEGAEPGEAGERHPPTEVAHAVAAAIAEELPPLFFALNATWLSPASRETLDRVVALLGDEPERRVVLSGHTDTAGPSDVNRALSRSRARRASRYLRDHGVAVARIEIHGFGSTRPLESTPTAASRAHNRRVEITLQ